MQINVQRINFIIESAILKIREVQATRIHNQHIDFERTLIEAIMWIAVGTEWFEQQHRELLYNQDSTEKKKKIRNSNFTTEYYYLLGTKQIFNSFKHNMSISSFNNIEYKKSPSNMYIQTVVWLKSNQMDIKYPFQYRSFKENFEQQPIIPTLTKAIKYLEVLHSRSLRINV